MTVASLAYAYISNGKKHEMSIARKVPLPPGSVAAIDRGYDNYKLFGSWTTEDIFFVIRINGNADYTVIAEKRTPFTDNVLQDQRIDIA